MVSSRSRGFLERSLTGGSVPTPTLPLEDGSRIAVLGSGPAGSFFSYFLLEMASRVGVDLSVDVIERKSFDAAGPAGCNMCGGIISESLVQTLATEGINLPSTVVERGVDSYVLHMDVGTVRIDTPLHEKRIASVHRGAGPKDLRDIRWESFDGHLQHLARSKGANVIRARVEEITLVEGRPRLKAGREDLGPYDLLVVAAGVNTGTLKVFESLPIEYRLPRTTTTFIAEYYLGEELVEKHLGSSMHVFLLNLPRLEFAAMIPKGEYASLCVLGRDVDETLVKALLDSPQMRECLPPGWEPPPTCCRCSPRINVRCAPVPYADRIVFIGDSGASRLYKDGIGAAYRTAKAAASSAIFHGVSKESFKKHYWPVCRAIENDNRIGKLIFLVTREIQRRRMERMGVLRMVSREQQIPDGIRPMSTVLWDTFTGSAPYRDIILRTFHPGFFLRFGWEILAGLFSRNGERRPA
jgi:flavin-dependent dehydrogenase